MSRLEKAARDYAIALLAPTGDLYTLDALESVERLDGLECWAAVNRALGYLNVDDPHTHLRLVRARVALYLRLMRRVEAATRDERWARFPASTILVQGVRCCFGHNVNSWDAIGDMLHADAWRPLWLDAPRFDPRATAADRRGAR